MDLGPPGVPFPSDARRGWRSWRPGLSQTQRAPLAPPGGRLRHRARLGQPERERGRERVTRSRSCREARPAIGAGSQRPLDSPHQAPPGAPSVATISLARSPTRCAIVNLVGVVGAVDQRIDRHSLALQRRTAAR